MTDPGLNRRLRQRSRRAGLMIGISMACAIAICVGAFSVIYAALDDTFGDFVSRAVPTIVVTPPPTEAPPSDDTEQPAAAEAQAPEQSAPIATTAPQPTATVESTPAEGAFTPDYQIGAGTSVNLRSEPSAEDPDTIVETLPNETPLRYLGEDAPAENPGDGDRWMRFRTEDGAEGWVREIDVEAYEP